MRRLVTAGARLIGSEARIWPWLALCDVQLIRGPLELRCEVASTARRHAHAPPSALENVLDKL